VLFQALNLTKSYPGVTALDGVSLDVAAGEVVGLIGENGAGKSTLIKIAAGLTQPDEGELRVDGRAVRVADAGQAAELGIGIIHQELNNLDNLDVAGNVMFGREPLRLRFLIDRAELERRAVAALRRLGLELDPRTPLRNLSVASQQLVEIAKALSLDARLLIMDEPTSSLTAGETETLLCIVEDLRRHGVGIIYVSHRLGEVQRVADRVVGLRDGRNAGELRRDQINHEAMVRLMVGRDLTKASAEPKLCGNPRLIVQSLRTRRYPRHTIDFQVCAGEIVGVAGLVGAGRSEVARSIFGVDDRLEGRVSIDAQLIPPGDPSRAIAAGLFLAPEDRRKEGVLTTMTIRENVSLPSLHEYSRGGLVSRKKETKTASEMRDRLRIKAPSIESTVKDLSGGNQQKVVLAKWLAMRPKCLIFDEPTRGIDIGARFEIYELMRTLANEGVAILMISSDMEEVLAMSDKIVVMREGALTGTLSRAEASEEAIMSLAVASA
jgi:ribose transport system ATP-binding protein